MLSTFKLFLVLYWLLRWADFFAFFSEFQAVGCAQHLFIHLARQIRTLRMASHTVLPILHRQERSSRCCRVMHVSDILPGCEHKLTFPKRYCKLTFLSVTDMYVYVHMYIARIDPSFKANRVDTEERSLRTMCMARVEHTVTSSHGS